MYEMMRSESTKALWEIKKKVESQVSMVQNNLSIYWTGLSYAFEPRHLETVGPKDEKLVIKLY